MKFIVSKELQNSSLIRILILFFLLSIALFFAFQPFLEKESLGLNIEELTSKILGNEELFIPALSFSDLLERIHIDLFLRLIAALSLLAITVRLMKNKTLLLFFILTLNISIFLNALSPILVHFGWSYFAFIKVSAYWVQHILFWLLILYCFFKLIYPIKRISQNV